MIILDFTRKENAKPVSLLKCLRLQHTQTVVCFYSGMEFGECRLNKAANMVKRWQAFMTKAEAYMRGQVSSAPINDPYLLERYVQNFGP